MSEPQVLWGISFDGTAISGVVVEFIKLAEIFRAEGWRIHLDLGYDIKADKNNFFRPYGEETAVLPEWVCLDRVDGLGSVDGYDEKFVRQMLHDVVQERDPQRTLPLVDAISEELAQYILRKWRALGVSFVIVENGTLPENIAYTKALYAAIEQYGRSEDLGTYVLWRDHDLMWSSEPGIRKYGKFPYRETIRPVCSPFIRYVTLHEDARRRLLEWIPELPDVAVLPNEFNHVPAIINTHNADFRDRFGIPDDAFLVCRYTRIIKQKRIDRDIHLIAALNAELSRRGISQPAYLFVAGDTSESPAAYLSLTTLAESLGIRRHVIFGGQLAPLDFPARASTGFTVRDLLAHSDLASFLTSYDYESYGNPVGEAIASGVPYLSTRYQAYDPVYGDQGYQALVMDITVPGHDLPTGEFAAQVADLLLDKSGRREMARFNYQLSQSRATPGQAKKLLSGAWLPDRAGATVRAQVEEPWPEQPMHPAVQASVVVPVYNEADSLSSVLNSLYDQWNDGRPLDRQTYELVLVDNNCTDQSLAIARSFAADHPDLALVIISEAEQGVACARKTGMDLAVRRSHERDLEHSIARPFYLASADADCRVDKHWLAALLRRMKSGCAAIGVCDYYYPSEAFASRPRLWNVIQRTLRCRQAAWHVFGGFPDGKGFAVSREAYERVGGIEIAYQLQDGKFRSHLSDDWDFGIKVRAAGGTIAYVPDSRVEINPRRVDHALEDVITGKAYGTRGIITMRNIRADRDRADGQRDLTPAEAQQAWDFSIKDFTPKNIILPLLLTPSLAADKAVTGFLTSSLAEALARRGAEIATEMSLANFLPIHSYKVPCYRLYLEFADDIFARLRFMVGEDVGFPPPLPACFGNVPQARFKEFVRYYCEDRESGEAHDYFGNGGVF
jgi:GT2 family glycosyltransferase